MTKLNVVTTQAAKAERQIPDYVNFDRWVAKVVSVARESSAINNAIERAYNAMADRMPDAIENAISTYKGILTWVDDLDKRIAECNAEHKIYEPDEIWDGHALARS